MLALVLALDDLLKGERKMGDFNKSFSALLICSLLAAASIGACSGDESTFDSGGGMGGESGGAGGNSAATGGTFNGVAGEGLQLVVNGVSVSEEGVAVVDFSISDAAGRALDLYGEQTFGAVSPSFVLSYLNETEDGESAQYTAYTTTVQEAANGDQETQSSTDSGGSYETVAVGHYKYTLGTKIDMSRGRSRLTHSLGVYATRTVGDLRYVSSDLKSWVPDGSPVTTILDVVTDDACNACHTRLEAHGGSRRGVLECQLCHTEENSIDPQSGNTIDFQVMIHKIHMGSSLPSVQGGDPYQIIGYRDSVHDFGEVEFPWSMSDCGKCHQGTQGDRWITRPAEKPCSSCHDRTYFGEGETPEGWTDHTAGPRDDSECIVCHGEDSLEPISKSHTTSLSDPNWPKLEAKVVSVKNGGAGKSPEVGFEITLDGSPVDILSDPPDRLRLRIFGPTTDVKVSLGETLFDASGGVMATACASPAVAPCVESSGDGFIFHSTVVIPADAEGTYMAGLDGRLEVPEYGRIAFMNPVRNFRVTGSETLPRREIISLEACNSCHGDLGPHGGNYKNPLYCLNCHNTTAYSYDSAELMPGGTVKAMSINFKDLIHSFHGEVAYPAPQNDCQQCHLPGTYELPLPSGLSASTYASVDCPTGSMDCAGMGGAGNAAVVMDFELKPEGAACVSCHNETSTVVHAETNSGASGEACATCHGAGKGEDVGVVHALSP